MTRGVQTLAGLGGFAGEQALRTVATLVAQGGAPEDVFAAVTAEVRQLLRADLVAMRRYDPDGMVTNVGWSAADDDPGGAGIRMPLGGRNVTTSVLETGQPARRDDYTDASGATGEISHDWGVRSSVGVPISVEGRLWGLMLVSSRSHQALPADTEARLTAFTELVGTAIANGHAHMELRGFAAEQAALRRVATLVAQAAAPEEIFAAVTAELGQLLSCDFMLLNRYEPNDSVTVLGAWSATGLPGPLSVGNRVGIEGNNAARQVRQSGRPVRIDRYEADPGEGASAFVAVGMRTSVAAPIIVDGRLWGVTIAISRGEPLPADTERRLVDFTELVGTAIANTEARIELRGFAEEQAALRRVATLVARGSAAHEVFAVVTAELGRVFTADRVAMIRYDPDRISTTVGVWSRGMPSPVQVGAQIKLGGRNATTLVFDTGRPARIDDYAHATGEYADNARVWGMASTVGVPVTVGERLWGVILVSSSGGQLPAATESRLASFTELVATAVVNAESQAALTASRARIVATADATRRRIERDLHDGAQQRLVSLVLQVRAAQADVALCPDRLNEELDRIAEGLSETLDELREIARGIHPASLTEGGLGPALRTLARRSPVPVRLDIPLPKRLPETVELAAYYAVAETLTNTVKHADASAVDIVASTVGAAVRIDIRDNGRGGATIGRGSGLIGLTDRLEAIGGRLTLESPPGAGTTVMITLPLQARDPSQTNTDENAAP